MRTAAYRDKERDYIAAARVLGAGTPRILFRHLLPNTVAIIVTLVPFTMSGLIFALTSLDYLGFGLPPEYATWGRLLNDGLSNLSAPWLVTSTFTVLVGLLVLITFVGEAVREAFDPEKIHLLPMTRRTTIRLSLACLGALALAGTGCHRETAEATRKLGFDAFVPVYNRYIENWLKEQQVRDRPGTGQAWKPNSPPPRETLAEPPASPASTRSDSDQEKWRFRLVARRLPEDSANPPTSPRDLVWENGMDQPEIGDPAAKKGGVFRRYIPSFPPTIRPFGDNSNNSFRGDLYDYIDMPLVAPPSGDHGDDPRPRQRMGGLRGRTHDLLPHRSRGPLLGRRPGQRPRFPRRRLPPRLRQHRQSLRQTILPGKHRADRRL